MAGRDTMKRGWRRCVVGVLSLAVILAASSAASSTAQADEVAKALEKLVSFEFEEDPLNEVAEAIEEQTGIEIAFDLLALEDLAIAEDTPVTIVVDKISLRSALELLLERVDPSVSFQYQGKVIEITTKEKVEANLKTRVFEVKDLVRVPIRKSRGAYSPAEESTQEESGFNHEPLIALLTSHLEPNSWDELGGAGRIYDGNKTLVVSHTKPILKRVATTLRTLREMKARREKQSRDFSPVRVEFSPVRTKAYAKIEAVLDRLVTVDYEETPLEEIVEQWQSRYGVPIRLDEPALQQFDIVPDTPVTFSRNKASVRQNLAAMLAQIDPAIRIWNRGEVLMITTKDKVDLNPSTVLYPVTDLLGVLADGSVVQDKHRLAFHYPDALVEAIVTTIEPTSWDEVGGPGRVDYDHTSASLVVTTSDDVQRKVLHLLTEVRRVVAERTKSTAANSEGPELPEPELEAEDDYATVVYLLWQSEMKETQVKESDLVKVLTEQIDPENWKQSETIISTLPRRLVIRQRKSVHRQIYQLLLNMKVMKPTSSEDDDAMLGGGAGCSPNEYDDLFVRVQPTQDFGQAGELWPGEGSDEVPKTKAANQTFNGYNPAQYGRGFGVDMKTIQGISPAKPPK